MWPDKESVHNLSKLRTLCDSRKYLLEVYPLSGGLLEIPRGEEVSKPKCLQRSMNQNWNFQRDGGGGGGFNKKNGAKGSKKKKRFCRGGGGGGGRVKPKNPPWEGCGYFL